MKGRVVSDKLDKTIIIKVDRLKEHPKYEKRFRVSKKYKVHDPENKKKLGDIVEFVACPPISKDKKWIIKND